MDRFVRIDSQIRADPLVHVNRFKPGSQAEPRRFQIEVIRVNGAGAMKTVYEQLVL